MPMQLDGLRRLLNETANNIDDYSHNVLGWHRSIQTLLEDLEFLAMANDPDHPQEFLSMLEQLKKSIEARLNQGKWEQ